MCGTGGMEKKQQTKCNFLHDGYHFKKSLCCLHHPVFNLKIYSPKII